MLINNSRKFTYANDSIIWDIGYMNFTYKRHKVMLAD